MNPLIIQFSYLQVLDFLTTIAFLMNGVQEANPVVKTAMAFSSPLAGLLAVKFAAVALGFYCWRIGRLKLLSRMNLLFAFLVAWNLIALIFGTATRA